MPRGIFERKIIIPSCHPDRKHHSKGLCASCCETKRRADQGRDMKKAAEYARNWRLKNPEKWKAISQSDNKRRWEQNRAAVVLILGPPICAICKATENLHVDHDHKCCPGRAHCIKCIRGWLCSRHNKGIGLFRDNIEDLKQAIAYLEMKKI